MTAESGGLIRTAMIQPGVFYTFDAPFVRFLCVYSNVLEDPRVISTEGGTRPTLNDTQLTYLHAALTRCRTEKYTGAVILVVHHAPNTAGTTHGGSPRMLRDLGDPATAAGFWPHAVFSGHAHNYQRYTRTLNPGTTGSSNVLYMVVSNGGHGLDAIRKINGAPLRVLLVVDDTLTLENYDDTHYGFLRVTVDPVTMRIEYHQAGVSDDGRCCVHRPRKADSQLTETAEVEQHRAPVTEVRPGQPVPVIYIVCCQPSPRVRFASMPGGSLAGRGTWLDKVGTRH